MPPELGLRALAPPVEVGHLVEAMWWHPAFDDDPEHAYLRDVVLRAAELAVGGQRAAITAADAGLTGK